MLPAAASFKRQGANKGAIASFLVSTPESGVDSIAITYALLDPIMTVVRPLAAFTTGIAAGIIENSFTYQENPPAVAPTKIKLGLSGCAGETLTAEKVPARFVDKLVAGMKYACVDVWGDIALWFFVGLVLAGIITIFIPAELSEMVLGGGLLAMLAMLLLGMPIYICATASTPIAAAFLLKGASPGAVLVFLLAGPATNLASLSVLIAILGNMGTVRYLLTIAVSAVLFGLSLDWLYGWLAVEPRAIIEEIREIVPYGIKLFSATVLILLTLYHIWVRIRRRAANKKQHITGFPALQPGSVAGRNKPQVGAGQK